MSEQNEIAKDYYKDWPKPSCKYIQDVNWAAKIGVQYLNSVKTKPSNKPKCVVFDIDDTLVFGDPESIIGVREMELGEHDGQEIFILPKNEPIVKLADYCKANGFFIAVITARPKTSRLASLTNMNMFKIPYDCLVMNDADDDPCFKVNVRRKLAEKYNIVLTVGDMITDLLLCGTAAILKLPDPDSRNSYFGYF